MKYRVNSIFPTIQGEGRHSGKRSLFIRLAHCNLNCSWCDTEFNTYTAYSWDDLQKEIKRHGEFVHYVVTGGEPTLNPVFLKLIPFLQSILKERIYGVVGVESNGTIWKPEFPDLFNKKYGHFTISPKQDTVHSFGVPYHVHPENYSLCDEVKLVVDGESRKRGVEGMREFLKELHKKADTGNKHKTYSLSPEYNEMGVNVDFIYKVLGVAPEWRLSLQTHKWIGYE